MQNPKFKIGQVIRSSLSSPQKVENIEDGKYHLRYLSGLKMLVTYDIDLVDGDYCRKEEWDKVYRGKVPFEKDIIGDFLDCTEDCTQDDKGNQTWDTNQSDIIPD